MSILEIPAKEATPYVKLDEDNGELEIIGKSYDEDVVMLFNMLRSKLRTFGQSNPDAFKVRIFLKYFNTASSKCLFDLLSDINTIVEDNGIELKMTWNYVEGDEEMEEEIEDMRESLDMEFEIAGIEDDIL